MKNLTLNQIAMAVGTKLSEVEKMLKFLKPEVADPTVRVYRLEDLPEEYQKAILKKLKDSKPAAVNVAGESSSNVNRESGLKPVKDDPSIYGESTPPIGTLPPLTPKLINALREIFGPEGTKNVLVNNYQLNPF